MKTLIQSTLLSLLIATCVGVAYADRPGRHPHYMVALSDLRQAREYLQHRSPNERVDAEEDHAIRKINEAIDGVKEGCALDGKNVNDRLAPDAQGRGENRFRNAMELLEAAHRDVAMQEDDREARDLQGRIIANIEEAQHIVARLAERR